MIAIHNEEIAWFKTKNLFSWFAVPNYFSFEHVKINYMYLKTCDYPIKTCTAKKATPLLRSVIVVSMIWGKKFIMDLKHKFCCCRDLWQLTFIMDLKHKILWLAWSLATNIYNGFKTQILLLAWSVTTNIYNGFKHKFGCWHDRCQRTFIMDLKRNLCC